MKHHPLSKQDSQSHLLVVDDDPGIRDLLCRYLGEQGFRVAAVEDGKAMDAWLAENTADLVILDLMLPGEDGLSLARRLRSDYKLPIVMISARGEEVDRIVGLEVGADDYLAEALQPARAAGTDSGGAAPQLADAGPNGTPSGSSFSDRFASSPKSGSFTGTATEVDLVEGRIRPTQGSASNIPTACSVGTSSWNAWAAMTGTRSTAVSTSGLRDCDTR